MILSLSELKLIDEIDARPALQDRNIKSRFNFYVTLPPGLRLDQARQDLMQTPRTGVLWIDGTLKQSVDSHQKGMACLMSILHDRDPRSIANMPKSTRIIMRHDLIQSVSTNLNITDPVTRDEKRALEGIAGRVLFEAFPSAAQDWREYQDKIMPLYPQLHDLNTLELFTKCLHIEETRPDLKPRTAASFWTSTSDRFKTAMGKEVYTELKRQHTDGTTSSVYTAMRKHYASNI